MDINSIIKQEYAKGTDRSVIADITGLTPTAVSKRAKRMGISHPGAHGRISKDSSSTGENPMQPTPEQVSALLAECQEYGIDPNNVKYFWHKSKKISAFVVSDQRPTYDQIRDEIISEMKRYAPDYGSISRSPIKDKHLLVIDPADIHVGKLSVKSETGYDYNIKKAVKMAHEGVEGIVQKASGFPIERIKLIIGNDVLHRDNAQNTTTSGTRQDVDGMWHQAFTAARKMYVEIIERLLEVADIDVVFNPANHDYVSGYMLADALACWFHTSKNITFDNTIKHRKYYQYGKNMIATTHGDGAKNMDMPLLMAQEEPKMWGNTKHRYIYQHHLHHRVKVNWQSVKDYPGITLEILRSPSAPDGWHHRNGYVGAPIAIEGFIHHKEYGQVARLSHLF